MRVAALEDVHAHQVATGRAALAGATPAPLEDVVVELGRGAVADAEVGADDVVALRLLRAAAAATAAATAAGAPPAPPPAAAGAGPRHDRGHDRLGDDGASARSCRRLVARRPAAAAVAAPAVSVPAVAGRCVGAAGAGRESPMRGWARDGSRRRSDARCCGARRPRVPPRRRRRWSCRDRPRRRCSRGRRRLVVVELVVVVAGRHRRRARPVRGCRRSRHPHWRPCRCRACGGCGRRASHADGAASVLPWDRCRRPRSPWRRPASAERGRRSPLRAVGSLLRGVRRPDRPNERAGRSVPRVDGCRGRRAVGGGRAGGDGRLRGRLVGHRFLLS